MATFRHGVLPRLRQRPHGLRRGFVDCWSKSRAGSETSQASDKACMADRLLAHPHGCDGAKDHEGCVGLAKMAAFRRTRSSNTIAREVAPNSATPFRFYVIAGRP